MAILFLLFCMLVPFTFTLLLLVSLYHIFTVTLLLLFLCHILASCLQHLYAVYVHITLKICSFLQEKFRVRKQKLAYKNLHKFVSLMGKVELE